jgi:RNA polymerase-binding transcription factor
MTKKQQEAMKKKLQEKRKSLVAAYITNKNYGRDTEDGDTQDIADKATNAYTKEFLYSLSNTDRQMLQMVDQALARMKQGKFGFCVECGEKMLPKRLEAVPWARHCIACQEREEKGLL